MKKIFALLLCAMFMFSFSSQKPTRVVFFGDSITEAGVRPGGYIVKMQEMLAASSRAAEYELIGSGIGGNKIYDLYLRHETDVLAQKPDEVVIYVGVNDVWHKRTHGTGTDSWKFVQFYEALILKMKAAGIRVILCTPACIGEKTDCTNEQDGELNQYSGFIRELAAKHGCKLCDLRTAFLNHNAQHNPENASKGILTSDGVHLTDEGNSMVARMLLELI